MRQDESLDLRKRGAHYRRFGGYRGQAARRAVVFAREVVDRCACSDARQRDLRLV
jgi:hypothetical protein